MSDRQLLFDREVPKGWQLLKVDELKADEHASCSAGPFGSNISSKYFVDEGIPVIRGANLRNDLTQFVPEGFVFVSPERAAKHYKGQHVRAGDLVFTCWGTLGQVGLIPKNGPFPAYIISNKQLKFRPNTELADPLYLFYYFACREMVNHINSIAIGAAVPGINLGILKNLDVVLPPLPLQRKIASILSAYDDLIENNTRRIAILEEMAQAIYREWFVNFRYPGHENVKLVDSPLGRIPEGWEASNIADIVTTQYGYTESAKDEPVGPRYLRGKDINKSSFIEWDSVPYCPITDQDRLKYQLHQGDVLVIRMADPGKVGIVEKEIDGVFASYLVRLNINDERIEPYYLFYTMLSDAYQGFISGASTGTTRKSASAPVLTTFPILIPPNRVISTFSERIGELRSMLGILLDKNRNLRTTRDLLLPKLISGKLDVEHLDIDTGLTAEALEEASV